MLAMSDWRREEGEMAVSPKFQGQSMTTDQKRAFLRTWAVEVSESDPARLPTIREAKAHIRENLGDAEGAGLGTDVISKTLRELREELNRKRLGPAGIVGHIEVPPPLPPTAMARMERLAVIARMMLAESIRSIRIDDEGNITSMESK